MYTGLRDYINFLESKGELIRITEFVDPVYEITEITNRVSKMAGGGKALLFENTGTKFPVITNMMGSEKRMLYTLGVESFDQITVRINKLMEEAMGERNSLMSKLKILPTLKEAAGWMPKEVKGIPPCQEVVLYKPELSRLPILKCWPQDGGRFITLPLVHTNDQKTGIRNVGMYRMQVFTENTTGMHWHRHKTGARHFDEFEGVQMPIAVCLGGDPIYTYAATAPLPDGIDEYLFAGFLRGKGVNLAKCLTQEIQVPADCDFVIEGYIDKHEAKVIEGPFGDHTGFYSLADLYPTMHITCISHRKDAIYPATVVGIPPQEDKYIAIATEKIFLSPIKFTIAPEIEDLYLPEEGVGHNFAIVKINKRYPGQAIKIAHAMWGAGQMMFNKILIIVDSTKSTVEKEGELNIRDRKELLKYIKEHYNPKRDTYFSRGPLDVLDHTAPVCGFGGKMCIDATVKLPEECSGGINTINDNNTSNNYEHFIKFIHKNDPIPSTAQIVVIINDKFSLDNIYQNLWLLGGNTDVIRDSKFAEVKNTDGNIQVVLVLDATEKNPGINGFNRQWPNIVESSAQTIASVNAKWKSLGI
ncbi:MAG: menaquinone biosynthesis decarboxylase [Bacteroidales bacterium]